MNSLADELKEQEFLGYWWLPVKDGAPQDNRAGVLHFKPDKRANINLLGAFERDVQFLWRHPFKKYPVIQGAAHDLKRFSLFDCVTTNQNYNSSEPAELAAVQIDFIEGWVGGESYVSKDDICFLDFTIGMDGLAPWHNASAFESKYDFQNQNADLHYMCPKPVTLFKDDLVEIELTYSWQGPSQQVAQKKGSISHDSRIRIKSLNGKLRYYGDHGSYHFYLSRMRTVLGLMIGRGCSLYDCSGLAQKYEPLKDGGTIPEIILRHLWRREMEDSPPMSPFDVWIPYNDVNPYLKQVVEKFINMDEVPAGFSGHIVYMNGTRRTNFTQGILPELVYLFEGLHRELYGDPKKKLKARFNDEFSRICGVFPFLDLEERDKLVKYVKDRRNKYSHANPDTYHENFLLYIYVTTWMRMFLVAMLLEYCGMPVNVLYAALSKNHEYATVAKNIPLLLQKSGL